MGLLSAFGVGGGSVSVQLQSSTVAAGGAIQGTVRFAGGKRAQNITALKVRLTATEQQVSKQAVMDPKGTAQAPITTTQTRVVIPDQAITGAITSQPGQMQEFPFSIQVPPSAEPTQPGVVNYVVTASADIDGEIDPGGSAEVVVTGGAMGFGPKGAGVAGDPFGKQNYEATVKGYPPVFENAKGAAALAMGAPVQAQWQDGNWYPGKIVAMQNGMYGVDWDDPKMGASSWVQPNQVSASTPEMPPAPAPLAMGATCWAVWQDGSWQAARVVAMQNGMYGVDWDDPKLGASSWVQPNQVSPR